ncbi:MAG: FIST N-terminal domain-containing protein [Candidatus Omnitrophica bacterium]|nr:FIST N-terminal domain-containing protein [Candidatus Omnitrophota bacterium]
MAIQIGIGLSTQKDPFLAAKEATSQARSNLHGTKINLAIVFSSVELASPTLLKYISNYAGDPPIVGCSGAAIISNRGIFKHGVIIMLLCFPDSDGLYFNTACVKDIHEKFALSAGEELGDKLLYGLKNMSRHLSVIFSDGMIEKCSDLISGLQEKLGISFPLVGASASDNLAFKKTYVYFNQEVFNNAACGILWGSRLSFGLGTKHGWKSLGKPRLVTKSSGNIVNEIDNTPAVKIYEDYLALDRAALKKELKRISIFYPIGIKLSGEQEFLLRNVSSIEEDGSIVFQGNVPEKSVIRLMIGTKETCLSATYQALEEAKKGLFGQPVKFALVFDSVSRYILLGRDAHKELEIIKQALGKDTAIIGLYTYGEQAPLRAINYLGKAYFHNQTFTILIVGG